jgi:hypothetical protein
VKRPETYTVAGLGRVQVQVQFAFIHRRLILVKIENIVLSKYHPVVPRRKLERRKKQRWEE